MSLFGDDYSGPPSRGGGQPTKSSLFDDDSSAAPQQPSPAKPSTSTSMFGDAADDDDGSSPWASFTPKKPQRRSGAEVVRSLLADAEVPESYVDAWEALAAGRRGESGAGKRAGVGVVCAGGVGG
jgi:sorting nexin-8